MLYAMERTPSLYTSEGLIEPNIAYLAMFTDVIYALNLDFDAVSIQKLVKIIGELFDEESMDIITRRILGQSTTDIAFQMELDWLYVKTITVEAPSQLRLRISRLNLVSLE